MPPTTQSAKTQKRSRFRRKRVRMAGEPTALDLIEEGIHLLRRTSLISWSVYLCGLAPFVVGFLFFWTEMASSGLAPKVLLPGSIGLAILFVWLKVTQAYFSKGIRDALIGQAETRWSLTDWFRVLREQTFWQATGLFVLPIAAAIVIPFAWCFAFYQNLLVEDPQKERLGTSHILENWQLSRQWPEQNWTLLLCFGLILFLGWINWLSILMFGPNLLKTLFGIETTLSMAGGHLFNSTSLSASLLLAYVTTDPVIKATYLLRRHYSESRRSGADLSLRLKRSILENAQRTAAILGVTLVLSLLATPLSTHAESIPDNGTHANVDELDTSIDEVLSRREFIWRFPREILEEGEGTDGLKSFFDYLEDLQNNIESWFEDLFGKENAKEETKTSKHEWDGNFTGLGSFLSYLIIGIFVCVVLYMAVRAWRNYEPLDTIEGAVDHSVEIVPNLEDENVSADQLPRNRWVELARELIAKGEYRLALRAYFLAQLSDFSTEGLIVIRRSKSNREYAREISRRGHGRSQLLDVYYSEIRLFESTWYGGRNSGPEEIQEMEQYLTQQGVLL